MERKQVLNKIDKLQKEHCESCPLHWRDKRDLHQCFDCPIGKEIRRCGDSLTNSEKEQILAKGKDMTIPEIERLKHHYEMEYKEICKVVGMAHSTFREMMRNWRKAVG